MDNTKSRKTKDNGKESSSMITPAFTQSKITVRVLKVVRFVRRTVRYIKKHGGAFGLSISLASAGTPRQPYWVTAE